MAEILPMRRKTPYNQSINRVYKGEAVERGRCSSTEGREAHHRRYLPAGDDTEVFLEDIRRDIEV